MLEKLHHCPLTIHSSAPIHQRIAQLSPLSVLPFSDALKQDLGLEYVLTSSKSCVHRRYPKGVTAPMFFSLVKNLYEKHSRSLKPVGLSQNVKIPLIMHVIWFGKPLPKKYAKWHHEWKKQHKGWKVICWTEALLKKHFPQGLYNQKMFEQARKANNFAKMSDVARYEILHRYGGLYLDFDIQNFKEITPLHYAYDFYAGLEEVHNEMELGNAIIGCKKGHPIIQYCIEKIKHYTIHKPDMRLWDTPNAHRYEVNHTLITTGPVLLTHAVWHKSKDDALKNIVFPSLYFYCTSNIHEASICKHYFCDTWVDDIRN